MGLLDLDKRRGFWLIYSGRSSFVHVYIGEIASKELKRADETPVTGTGDENDTKYLASLSAGYPVCTGLR